MLTQKYQNDSQVELVKDTTTFNKNLGKLVSEPMTSPGEAPVKNLAKTP